MRTHHRIARALRHLLSPVALRVSILVSLVSLVPLESFAAPLKVVTTTGIIADGVTRIAGDEATVEALMGPGVDPHLYKATQGDLVRLSSADLIFFNGVHLEGKMTDILEKLAQRKPTIAVSRDIDKSKLRSVDPAASIFDPHIWFDVELWSETLPVIVDELAKLRPEARAKFAERAASYKKELDELHQWIKTEIATIPVAQRVLITAHDAFGYFGRAYSIEVMGLQGISTASEFGLFDLKQIADVIMQRKIKAVFVESSVPHRFIIALQEGVRGRGGDVALGGELYSDALGPQGTPEGTYPGMVRHNVEQMVRALR